MKTIIYTISGVICLTIGIIAVPVCGIFAIFYVGFIMLRDRVRTL